MKLHGLALYLNNWKEAPGSSVLVEVMPLHEIGVGHTGSLLNLSIDRVSICSQEMVGPAGLSATDDAQMTLDVIFRVLQREEVLAAVRHYLTTIPTLSMPKEIQ